MSKRKRLFERGDSYRETGVPCGNPKRVQSGDVLCMPSASTPTAAAALLQREDMETQAEKQLRAMAQKQLNTDITVKDLLSQRRQFTEAGQYKPLTKEIKGMMGLQDYRDVAKGDQRVEALRQCGLTEDEIRLQLDKEGMEKGLNSSFAHKSTFGVNPDIHQDQLEAIEAKMKEKEAQLAAPDSFRGRKEISRQEMDIEKSMFWGTDRDSNALSSLLTKKQDSGSGHPDDPTNHLPQIMAEIEERTREKIREKRRRRRRNRRRGQNRDDDCDNIGDNKSDDDGDDDDESGVIGCLTLEEMTALKQAGQSAGTPSERTDGACSQDAASDSRVSVLDSRMSAVSQKQIPTVKNSGSGPSDKNSTGVSERENSSGKDLTCSEPARENFRKVLKGPIEFLPVEYIKENQLSLEEIKKLPKFTSYEAGTASNVLYVKNLSPRVSEHDLVSLFGRFQNRTSEIVYKLMTGRMRGQAFVTFCNTDVASQALQLVNGFMLHGKPVIVQYGKRTTA